MRAPLTVLIQPRTLPASTPSSRLRRPPTGAAWKLPLAVAAAGLLAACSDSPTLPSVQATIAASAHAQPLYDIADLGTLGGSFSIAFDVSDGGVVTGAATVPGEYEHGFRWVRGQMTDVGTLEGSGTGLNAQAAGRAGSEVVSILSEVSAPDPLNENFCGFGTNLLCRAGVWRKGVMTPLPGLGGNNAAALTMNGQGQIVGLAEDGVLDGTCMEPQKSHFQAVTWEQGRIRVLPPLAGDEVAMAVRNNDNGQVVGTSGLCSNTTFGGTGMGAHAVLWDHGTPIGLGNLGDPNSGFAAVVNNKGEVFGAAGLLDGTIHPFRWTKTTGIQDLGLMSPDPMDRQNTPFNANDRGQMVGASCDVAFELCRGYLWQDNVFTDINSLLPPDGLLYVIAPLAVNQAGQIAGLALDLNTFEAHAFLATPRPGMSSSNVPHAARGVTPPRLSASVRQLVRRRGFSGAR